MKQSIRILKIVRKLDYFTSCCICHRKLKNALETTLGTLGFDCFCREIGIPYVAKQKLLPKEVYENLAISIVEQINQISIEEFGKQNLYFNFKDHTELEFPIRYVSKINIRIYPKEIPTQQGNWINLSIITRLADVISRLLQIDATTMREVMKTQPIQDWFSTEQGKGMQYPLGRTLQEMSN